MVPSVWKSSVVVPVLKKKGGFRGACRTDEFRWISLVSVVYKAMCIIVQDRLLKVVEERQLLAEEQGGFRRGGESIEIIF